MAGSSVTGSNAFGREAEPVRGGVAVVGSVCGSGLMRFEEA